MIYEVGKKYNTEKGGVVEIGRIDSDGLIHENGGPGIWHPDSTPLTPDGMTDITYGRLLDEVVDKPAVSIAPVVTTVYNQDNGYWRRMYKAAALQGIIACPETAPENAVLQVKWAAEFADACLAEDIEHEGKKP